MLYLIIWFVCIPLLIVLLISNMWIAGIVGGIALVLISVLYLCCLIGFEFKKGKQDKLTYIFTVFSILGLIAGIALFIWGIATIH